MELPVPEVTRYRLRKGEVFNPLQQHQPNDISLARGCRDLDPDRFRRDERREFHPVPARSQRLMADRHGRGNYNLSQAAGTFAVEAASGNAWTASAAATRPWSAAAIHRTCTPMRWAIAILLHG
jgi:hypothetical protein